MPEIGIIVVHGIGEQERIETLTSLVGNFYKALKVLNIKPSRSLTLQSPSQPATLSFRHQNLSYTVRFYEAYWADLDQSYTLLRWLKFIGWGLTIWAARRYYAPLHPPMHVINLGRPREVLTRIGLFVLSIVFLILLLTLRVLNAVVVAVFKQPVRLGQTLYNFVGDVHLFVNEEVRYDKLEALDRKSRYAIRHRLWEVLARAHLDPHVEDLYILAHSLGSVITFNALMEPASRIGRYFDDPTLRQDLQDCGLIDPHRMVDRTRLLSKIRALFTVGSPLDKFATIWPRIIPINRDPRPNVQAIRWFNVHDKLDLVGGKLDYFKDIPGLTDPQNIRWRDQSPLTAHTRYWTHEPGGKRFIDRFVEFILDETPINQRAFTAPENRPLWSWLLRFLGLFAACLYLLGVIVTMIGIYLSGGDLKISQILLWFTLAGS
jgi:hypothetical protein